MLPGLWRLFSVRFVWHCCLPVRQETLRPVFKSSKCIFNLSQVLALPCSWMHRFMCARSVSAILLRDWWYQINNSIQSAKLSPAKCESHGGDNTALYQSITRARAHMNAAPRTCTRTRHTHEGVCTFYCFALDSICAPLQSMVYTYLLGLSACPMCTYLTRFWRTCFRCYTPCFACPLPCVCKVA